MRRCSVATLATLAWLGTAGPAWGGAGSGSSSYGGGGGGYSGGGGFSGSGGSGSGEGDPLVGLLILGLIAAFALFVVFMGWRERVRRRERVARVVTASAEAAQDDPAFAAEFVCGQARELEDHVETSAGTRVQRNGSSNSTTKVIEYWTLAKREERWILAAHHADRDPRAARRHRAARDDRRGRGPRAALRGGPGHGGDPLGVARFGDDLHRALDARAGRPTGSPVAALTRRRRARFLRPHIFYPCEPPCGAFAVFSTPIAPLTASPKACVTKG